MTRKHKCDQKSITDCVPSKQNTALLCQCLPSTTKAYKDTTENRVEKQLF